MSAALKIDIDKLVMGGLGLGRRDDGMVVLVPHVLPGETVRVLPVRKKKSYLDAALQEVINASPDRTSPPCPYFGRCGGCDMQHVLPAKQALLKNDILREHMIRTGVIAPDDSALLLPPVMASKAFGYRQRIRLHVDRKANLCYRHSHSHGLEPVTRCLLAVPEINQVLSACIDRQGCAPLLFRQAAEIEFQHCRRDNSVVLLAHMKSKPGPSCLHEAKLLLEAISELKAVVFAAPGFQGHAVDREGLKSATTVEIQFSQAIAGNRQLSFSFEAGGFCQVNHDQNAVLLSILLEWAGLSGKDRVLDLFCGMGNFSLPMALHAGEVVGVDLKRSSIRSAANNAEANGIANCSFTQQSATQAIQQLVKNRERFDLVLLDPPRQGCADVVPYLSGAGAGHIIYISCDPATLGRDLLLLKGKGFRIEKMRMVDMFPQTHHMETAVRLIKV